MVGVRGLILPPRTIVPNIPPPSQHCFDPTRFGLCHAPQQ